MIFVLFFLIFSFLARAPIRGSLHHAQEEKNHDKEGASSTEQ